MSRGEEPIRETREDSLDRKPQCKGPEAGARLARPQSAADGVPWSFGSSGWLVRSVVGAAPEGWLGPVRVDVVATWTRGTSGEVLCPWRTLFSSMLPLFSEILHPRSQQPFSSLPSSL